MVKKTGLLVLNLGTPNSPSRKDVRTYLKEFLYDPRVVDLPSIPRWLLLHLIILPFRSRSSSQLYQSIWTEAGSPLLYHSEALCDELRRQLDGSTYEVALGMRYGQPSIEQAINQLMAANVERMVVLPLFPQYSSAATGSAIESVLQHLSKLTNIPSIHLYHDFYAHPAYLEAMRQTIQPILEDFNPDHLLFSYHGLPERQIKKSESLEKVGCNLKGHCPAISLTNRFCYRAQCYETTRLLTQTLNLQDDRVSTSFQSRLGKTPWIKPYTDETLKQLAKQGIKKLAIACPSFVADCLETLEEIAVEAKSQWHDLGGESLEVIPCLNSNPAWAKAIIEMTNMT